MHLIKDIFAVLFSLEEDALRTPRRILLPPIPSKFVAVPNLIRNPVVSRQTSFTFPGDDRPYFSNPVFSQFIIHLQFPYSPLCKELTCIPCFIFSCFSLSFPVFALLFNQFSLPILSFSPDTLDIFT